MAAVAEGIAVRTAAAAHQHRARLQVIPTLLHDRAKQVIGVSERWTVCDDATTVRLGLEKASQFEMETGSHVDARAAGTGNKHNGRDVVMYSKHTEDDTTVETCTRTLSKSPLMNAAWASPMTPSRCTGTRVPYRREVFRRRSPRDR